MRRSGVLIAVFAVVLATLTAAPASAATPITGTNRPTPLNGQTNGEVSSGELVRVSANCVVSRASAPSLRLLLESAQHRGIALSADYCYRPLSAQVSVGQSWTNAGNSACAAQPTRVNGKVVGTSMHGWGKAVDFGFGGGSWGSAGFRYLESNASAYGWNHPAWAKPGGSACPEAWHWEWVGDGGQEQRDGIRADVVALLPGAGDNGYSTVTGLGAVNSRGAAANHGGASGGPINWVMVGAANTPDRNGYWLVGADGGIFSYGSAAFHGSAGGIRLNKQVVGMAATPSGNGYWLVASDGGVFSYGDARFFGSTGSMRLNKPIVGMAATPSGNGYWLVASDGGIFAFGDAPFYGSTGSMRLNQPVMGMTASPSGDGYWLVASDGGVFSFGNAPFHGSAGSYPPAQPVVSIARTTSGAGYWITSANGNVYAYGNARHYGAG